MFKRSDYLIIAIACFFLGIFIISQFYANKKTKLLTQPENNEVLTLEVAKYTKTNANLRLEVQSLTMESDTYKNKTLTSTEAFDKYKSDVNMYDSLNGVSEQTGQGIIINIVGSLGAPQVIDLVNALKNIGVEFCSINGTRLTLNTDLSVFAVRDQYEIKAIGNSTLLKSAIERKGGIIDLIATKSLKITLTQADQLTIPAGQPTQFIYAKIIR